MNSKSKNKIATVLACTMVSSSFVVAGAATTSNETIIGKNRIETAIKISKDGWSSAETVILVNDSAIPDALTATPLAHAKNAPILLTGKNGLNKETANEIKRLGATNVIMIGGYAVLPAKIEKELKALKVKVDRVKGATREETALEIAKRLDGIKDVSEIAVVNGTTGLADAVSIAAAAAERNMPIILANPKKGLSASAKFIKDEAIKSSFIIGGKTVLADKLVSNLPGKYRIEGSDRNDTNAKVIAKFYSNRNLDNIYLAKDGRGGDAQLIDALAVGALAAKNGAPVLIASKKLSSAQVNVINTKKVDTITQVGGKGNEGAFNHLKDIEKVEVIKVKNESELQEALSKANANDVIEIEGSISKDVNIKTDNAVDIVIKGELTGEVTVKTPNADIKNSGTIGTLVVENGKNTTVTNTSSGKIDKVEVSSSSSNIKVENNGKIDKVENNASGTTIENNGTISKPVTGTEKPSVEGNKPGSGTTTGGTTSGGGSSTGGTVKPEEKVEISLNSDTKAFIVGEKINLNAKITTNGNADTSKKITWKSSNDSIATVDEKGVVTAKAAGDFEVTASVGKETKSIKLYVGTEHAQGETMKDIVTNAKDNAVVVLPAKKIESGLEYSPEKGEISFAKYKIKLSKNITLIGQGSEGENKTDISDTYFDVNNNNFAIKNLYITTNEPANEKHWALIYANSGNSSDLLIEDVKFDNVSIAPVDMWSIDKQNPGNATIKSSYIKVNGSNGNSRSGLLLWGTWGDIVIEDNEIIGVNYAENNISARNVQVKGFESLSMKNNTFDCGNTEDMTKVTNYKEAYNKSKYNVSLGHDSNEGSGGEMKNATISGNTFKNAANGIRILPGHSVDTILIEGNRFENVYNAFSPVYENGVKGIVFNNIVFKNNNINNAKVGYNLYHFDGATYSNCQILNNTMTNVVTPIHTNVNTDDAVNKLKEAFKIDGNTNNGSADNANEIKYEKAN